MLLFSRDTIYQDIFEESIKDIGQISTAYAPYITTNEIVLRKIFAQYAYAYFDSDSIEDKQKLASKLTARAIARGSYKAALEKKFTQCGFKDFYVHYNYDRPNVGENITYLDPSAILVNNTFNLVKNGDRSVISTSNVLRGAMCGSIDSFAGHSKNMCGAHFRREFDNSAIDGPTFPSESKYHPWCFYISGSPTDRTVPCNFSPTKFDFIKKIICDNKPSDTWCYVVKGIIQ